ncbi:MAG: GC-type dockerin domain-anchored protein [Planctomycetota bacterium]
MSFVDGATITARVSDDSGTVASVAAFFDSNDNNTLDAGDAELTAAFDAVSGELSVEFEPDELLSLNAFIARFGPGNRVFLSANDGLGQSSTSFISLKFANAAPVFTSALATPTTITASQSTQVTATASDVDGTVSFMSLAIDTNGNGVFDQGVDPSIGLFFGDSVDRIINGASLVEGDNTILVIATDNDGNTRTAQVTVTVAPCAADFNRDETLNQADVDAFSAALAASDLAADLNGNGVTDSGDIRAYLQAYEAGCP